ncbi:MAG TPA: 6-hydroxymethylpterin diphosphokinase MptE-like protein [Kofleriaceae bacterium]|nr:6-hydroxymethylpterin diphosphokinase MptE-like protein [Kofleriaceae bacterium]
MSLDVLNTWHAQLKELGELGDALCAAIAAGDVFGAISAMAPMRATRAALARVEAPLRLRGDADEIAALAEVSALTVHARVAEAAMQQWLDRELPGEPRLLASPLGIAVLADAILPPVWDFELDVVVLIGGALVPVADVLGALGQQRIVVIDPEFAGDVPDVIRVASIDEAALAVRTMVPGPPGRMVVRAQAGSDPALADELVGRLRDALGDLRVHRNTVHAFSRTWVEQGAANLRAVARWPSVAAIGDRFAGMPMVIVAPGPSLARNIDQLRDLRGRAILTAFSHSLKPVLAAGLVPDLVITVDPQDVRYHFEGCDLSQTCLVNAATVHPALFDLPAQRFLTLSANCAIDDWIFDGVGEDALVPGGGSVATTAFSLALKWRCDPIVFVGLDLSFPGGAYYVATSSDGAARAEVDAHGVMRVEGWSDGFHAMKAAGGPSAARERAIELPGWHGDAVPSSFMFSLFHRWFVEQLRAIDNVTVYNCTEGGAFIDGMVHRPLADVLATFERTLDVAGELDAAAMSVDAQRGARVVEHLAGFVRKLHRSRRLASVARKLIKKGETGRRLANVERSLAQTLSQITFASLLAQREVERAQDVARRPASEGAYVAASANLFDTLLGVIDQLEPALQAALERLGARRIRGLAA